MIKTQRRRRRAGRTLRDVTPTSRVDPRQFDRVRRNLSTRLPLVEIAAIHREAAARGVSTAELVREALRPLIEAGLRRVGE